MTTYQITLDSRLASVWRDPFDAATDAWEAVTGHRFTEVATGGTWHVVPLDEFLTLPGIPAGWSPLAGAIVYGSSAAYFGVPYDPSALVSLGYGTTGALVHELGHGIGFTDGQGGLYDYAHPIAGYSIANVEFVQRRAGMSHDSDDVTLYGSDAGTMSAGRGDDTVTGAAGDETIYGNQGADRLLGNAGDDTLFGGQDADTVYGGTGSDVIYGNRGNDVLSGGAGADTLYGGQGSDTIYGDADDLLFGNLGADVFVTDHPETVADFSAEQGDVIVPLLGQHLPENSEWIGA